jgi:alpha-galactosidase
VDASEARSPIREEPSTDRRESTWGIETESLSLTWRQLTSGEVQLTSLQTAGREWISSPTAMFSTVDDAASDIAFRDVTAGANGNILEMRGSLYALGLTASVVWTVYEPMSAIVSEIEIANETDQPVEIGDLASLRLLLAGGDQSQLGVLAGGRWDEAMPPRGYQLQTYDLDQLDRRKSFGAADDGRSSGEHVPWFALMDQDGGLLASFVWSGRWRLNIEEHGGAHNLVMGLSDFAHLLQPGEHLKLPGVVLCGFAGSLDDGANSWRTWAIQHWMPPVPGNWPWVQYNHWYAYYGDIDAECLLQEAREAAGVGCEVFVIDDGWFRGRRPESYFAGWGDWVEDRSKFPEGLQAFGESVRGLGMKFGLWVEPERADDNGELVRAHPDWVATRDGTPISRPGPTGMEGVHLCLGNPGVQRWMIADMIRVVREYGVDWLKWDYNIGYGLGCNADDHGHQATDGHYAHTLGLYHVLEQLRTACPDLVIENCASGGHRVDLGTLRHTHTNWISDYTHRAASCRQHVQGSGLFLPLHHLNTWVLNDRDRTEFRSRMGGAFGISCFMGQWSDGERDMFRHAVDEYKRLRPFLAGQRFLLTGPLHQDWEIWQFVHPSGEDLAVLAFREGGQISDVRVEVRVPVQDRSYLVQRSGAEGAVRISGAELAAEGIMLRLPERSSSEVIWVTAAH